MSRCSYIRGASIISMFVLHIRFTEMFIKYIFLYVSVFSYKCTRLLSHYQVSFSFLHHSLLYFVLRHDGRIGNVLILPTFISVTYHYSQLAFRPHALFLYDLILTAFVQQCFNSYPIFSLVFYSYY